MKSKHIGLYNEGGRNMLKELAEIWGVSGYEKTVSDYILEQVKAHGDEIVRDAVGNLIVLKRGNGENKKKIMVAAHMDEIGLCVVKITDEGFLKVKKVGGVSAHCSFMNRVVFQNGTVGTVAAYEKPEDFKSGDIDKLYIDIGAGSKEEAEKYVKVGDCAMFEGNYQELAGRNVMAKAFDDRSACYVQLETLKAMKTPYHDVYFVFTVQEEVGIFGATTSAERIKPDLGIAIDITGSFDVPGDKHGNAVLGKGAAICISNACVTCDEDMVGQMVECAKEHQIPYQFDVLVNGGTDAGAINKSYRGVKAVGISIPTRYGHSPNSIINLDDLQSCIELLKV
jgi:putative aminopeptidase FrvX